MDTVPQHIDFKQLDPVLHAQLRLAVMSLLVDLREAGFNYIRDKTSASAGNLSAQINKLKSAGYITVSKSFKDNYPQTLCKITPKGTMAFEDYKTAIRSYIKD